MSGHIQFKEVNEEGKYKKNGNKKYFKSEPRKAS